MKPKESDIQRTIEEGLTWLRYIVLHTQHQYHLQECPKCKHRFRAARGYGASQGIPDLLISRLDWQRGEWLGMEVKGPTTPVSEQQATLEQQGRIIIVRGWEEAQEAIREFEATRR